jgi:hypothetical protein
MQIIGEIIPYTEEEIAEYDAFVVKYKEWKDDHISRAINIYYNFAVLILTSNLTPAMMRDDPDFKSAVKLNMYEFREKVIWFPPDEFDPNNGITRDSFNKLYDDLKELIQYVEATL